MILHRDLIFDVGAHKGEDTDFYLKKGYNVVAFEADPELAAHCKHRFRAQIADGRLRVIEGAIASASAGESIVLYKNTRASVWGTINASWAERNAMQGARSVEITVGRVDIVEAFRTCGIPFYLKVDIEGADHVVLEGLQKFDCRPQYISIEAEKIDFGQLVAELNALRDLGYRRFRAVQQARWRGTRLTTTTLRGEPFDHVFEESASGPFGDDLPGPWSSYDECIAQYRRVFVLYRLFGEYSMLERLPGGSRLTWLLERLLRKPLPGWYDTHAALEP